MAALNHSYGIVLPSARTNARGIAATRFDAGLPDVRLGSRLALNKGGFPEMIPPLDSPDVNNRTPCQSPGKGRPH